MILRPVSDNWKLYKAPGKVRLFLILKENQKKWIERVLPKKRAKGDSRNR